jgi:hypothetical protein
MIIGTEVEYLNQGTDRQRSAFQVLVELDIFSVLAEYNPMVAGTIPLNIDVETSDLDICCYAEDLGQFEADVRAMYGEYMDFDIWRTVKQGTPTSIATFVYSRFTIELFAQAVPVEEQRAYRHMVAEARLLRLAGEDALNSIRQMKEDGIKTELAFGAFFHLEDDPYESLLSLSDADTETLVDIVDQAKWLRSRSGLRTIAMAEDA